MLSVICWQSGSLCRKSAAIRLHVKWCGNQGGCLERLCLLPLGQGLTLVDANGQVQDYRILSDSADARRLRPQLNNIMIFTTFQPATTFGVPTSGRAVLSFAKINVGG